MPKTRNINQVIEQAMADPTRRANIERERREAVAEIVAFSLAELRRAREITQVELARALGVGQPAVSGLERSADPLLSTLRDFIEGLGGHLELTAVFDGERFPLKA